MDAEAIAQELMAKKVPLLREEILQLASTSRIRDNIKQPASGAVLSLLAPIGMVASRDSDRRASRGPGRSRRSPGTSSRRCHKSCSRRSPSFTIRKRGPIATRNEAAVPNVVIKLSDFQGGGLWIEDPLGLDSQEIDGRTIQGTNTDFEQDTIVFNAKEALHMTLPWEGTRVVLAVYSVQGVRAAPTAAVQAGAGAYG